MTREELDKFIKEDNRAHETAWDFGGTLRLLGINVNHVGLAAQWMFRIEPHRYAIMEYIREKSE